MNRLHFDFLADKDNNTLTIVREFAAERQLVWDCYTQQAYLDRWFAPKPYTTKTKSMDFSNGGKWHYAMVSPEGQEHWCIMHYSDIHAIDSYRGLDAFADAEGNINTELPTGEWFVAFADKGDHSVVKTVVKYASLSDLETVINMGMEEGLKMTLENLDALLEQLKK